MIFTRQCIAIWAFLIQLVLLVPSSLQAVQVSGRLRELSRSLADNGSNEAYRNLEKYAATVSGSERNHALYALGMARYAARKYPEAEELLAKILNDTGTLNGHVAYYHASCIVRAEEFDRALGHLEKFIKEHPESRFLSAATRLRAESLLRLQKLEQARALLMSKQGPLEEPVRLYLAARVEHVSGNLQKAASLYREAYYNYPNSDQADASEVQLDLLRKSMGEYYPKAPAKWRLVRAGLLYKSGTYDKASAEYSRALSAGLAGIDRERALVGRGASDYYDRNTSRAYASLRSLKIQDAELDAERLYLVFSLLRRQGLIRPMVATVEKLSDLYPNSRWYEKALHAVGNHYLLKDNRKEYIRWFSRLVKVFPKGENAAYAHWKLCWRAWLDETGQRQELLTGHILMFPWADTTPDAFYWLGRLFEKQSKFSEAHGIYLAITEYYPHYYTALMARKRLSLSAIRRTKPVNDLGSISKALVEPRKLAGIPDATTQSYLERGQLLAALSLVQDAIAVLQRIDYHKGDAHFAGLELSRLHVSQDEYYKALRTMKQYLYGYLRFPVESLDREYWEHLFPLGWKDILHSRSERHGLDPNLIAGLIRQESEYNPSAKSRAGALGLMQIMPRTGRTLFQRLGISGFSNWKLTQPDVSLRLGTFHFKEVLQEFDGQLEYALASYNAGVHRVSEWLKQGPFEDIAEFVESIPFSETRGYVKSVIRNQWIYTELYGN